jgi:hypothetical protein
MKNERDIFRPSEHARPIACRIYDHMQKFCNRKADPNWIENELFELWKVTNYERSILGKGPVSLERIKSMERMAQGHIDYASKCALYCDDIVQEYEFKF